MTHEELGQIEGGKYKWDPIYGDRYPLGYQHGQLCGIHMTGQKEVSGFYFGSNEGTFKFFRIEDNKVFQYSSQSLLAYWLSDGDDGPSWPIFRASLDGEVPNSRVKDIIVNTIKKLEAKLESNSL